VDQPHVDVGQAGLPGDRPLSLEERRALDAVDQLLELRIRDGDIRLPALLDVRRGEPLDQLPGDPDHHLGGAEARHLLGFLQRDRAVVDHGADVRHGPRLHVGEALALPADAPHGPLVLGVDLEDQRLRELRPDIERGAGNQLLTAVALPEPAQEGHGHAA